MEKLTLEKFEETSESVKGVTTETRLVYSEYFSARTGNKVFFKPESMQYTRAYKVGDTHCKVHTLAEGEKSRGLIAASVGNHAQDMAYTTKLTGAKATVVMPTTTPLMKVDRTESYGAGVVLEEDVLDETRDHAYKLMDEFGYTFIHPFDNLDVATGQGTIAMEIIKELPTVDYILIPIGGGGLCIGVSTLAKLLNPKIKVIGVESANASYMQASLKEGEVAELPQVNTIADGAAARCPGERLFPYIQENVGGIVTIEDNELIVALLDMVENHRMIVEDPGFLTVAALEHLNVQKKKIVSILNGSNMDVITMSSITQYGPVERDRVFTVSTFLPGKPGEPARVSALLAKEQGSVIKLEHNQFISINRNAAVELHITIEAFGTDHKNQIVSALTNAGYRPKLVKLKGTHSEMQTSDQTRYREEHYAAGGTYGYSYH